MRDGLAAGNSCGREQAWGQDVDGSEPTLPEGIAGLGAGAIAAGAARNAYRDDYGYGYGPTGGYGRPAPGYGYYGYGY